MFVQRTHRAGDNIPVVAEGEIGGMSAVKIVNGGVVNFAAHYDGAQLRVIRGRTPMDRLHRNLIESAAGVPPVGRAFLGQRVEKQFLRDGRGETRIRGVQRRDLVVAVRQNHQVASVGLEYVVG